MTLSDDGNVLTASADAIVSGGGGGRGCPDPPKEPTIGGCGRAGPQKMAILIIRHVILFDGWKRAC